MIQPCRARSLATFAATTARDTGSSARNRAPPEEKLYPVIDGLLEAWHATGDRAIPHTKVIGHRWNERSWEVRQFLARNQHSFRSFMADEPKGRQLLDAAGLDGYQLPVVITEQGETLVEPTDVDLASMLGLSTSPSLEM